MLRQILLAVICLMFVQVLFAQQGTFRLNITADYKSPGIVYFLLFPDNDDDLDEEDNCEDCFFGGGFGVTLAPEIFIVEEASLVTSYSYYPRYRYAYNKASDKRFKALVQSYALDIRFYQNRTYISTGGTILTISDESEDYFKRRWGVNLAAGGSLGENSPFIVEVKLQTAQFLVGLSLGIKIGK